MSNISKYVEFYADRLEAKSISYSEVADRILEDLPDIGKCHRTLRRLISREHKEYPNKALREAAGKYKEVTRSTIEEAFESFREGLSNYMEASQAGQPDDYDKPIVGVRDEEHSYRRLEVDPLLYTETSDNQEGYVEQGVGWIPYEGATYAIRDGVYTYPLSEPSVKTYVVMGCVHFPFHNKLAYDASLRLIRDLRPDGIVLNGDILDMHSISRHNKGKITIPGLTLTEEYRLSNIELDRLDEILPEVCDKHYFYGNHEMWYYDYLSGTDASKLGEGVILSPSDALKLEERGYSVQTNYKTAHILLGDTEVHHGTYVTKHAAFTHAASMRRSNVFNHTHRTGSYLEGSVQCYNLGWMGDKDARVFGYMDRIQKESWTNGFGVVTVDGDNKSHVQQVTWKNNRFVFNGKMYK